MTALIANPTPAAGTLPTALGYSLAIERDGRLTAVGGPDGETVFDSTLEAHAALAALDIDPDDWHEGAALHIAAIVPVATVESTYVAPRD